MRLFFIEWNNPHLGMADMVEGLQAKGHQILYWSAVKPEERIDTSKFPGTIFHDHDDALFAVPPAGIDASAFPIPGEDEIRAYASVESETLTMMSKLFETMQVNERKHLYYGYLRYWNGVLDMMRPDAVIFPNVPHTVYDFVLYSICRKRNIKTILFELTRVNDRCLLMNDFREGARRLQKELRDHMNKECSLQDLPLDVRAYYTAFSKQTGNARPKDIVDLIAKYSGLRSLKVKARSFWTTLTVHKDFSVFGKLITHLPRKFRSNQRSEYKSMESAPDFSSPFIYVPLQYQPECTTSPLGGVFVDQLLMIETLAATLPQGWRIYVKEHPLQWKPRGSDYFSYRYRDFYRRMAALPCVRIVPVDTPSLTLIEQSTCTASVNGTAGWEALMRGKPSLVFGYAWYRDCPGVFRVTGSSSCRAALLQVAQGMKVPEERIINYLFSFGRISINGFRDDYCKEVSPITLEENIKVHILALDNALRTDVL